MKLCSENVEDGGRRVGRNKTNVNNFEFVI